MSNKTPEAVKKALECCARLDGCKECPYSGEKCVITSTADTLAYIAQLEAQVPKWISEGTPPQKEGEYIVIVRTADGKEERMWDVFHPNHGWCEDDEGNKVLYWMSFDSLHKPPKEDAHGI